MSEPNNKKKKCYTEKKEKKDKSFKSFRETLSGCLFSVIFEGLCFLSVGLSADSASVSLQRFPHHQRLQRGGGGWANISQALLRSPSTEKYAKTAGMEVENKGLGRLKRWVQLQRIEKTKERWGEYEDRCAGMSDEWQTYYRMTEGNKQRKHVHTVHHTNLFITPALQPKWD